MRRFGVAAVLGLLLALGAPAPAQEARPVAVQLELFRGGPSLSALSSGLDGRIDGRLLHVGVGFGRLRAGLSLVEVTALGAAALPAEFGYTLVQRPVPYGPFLGMAPDVFALATFYWVTNAFGEEGFRGPSGQLAVAAEADRFGLGIGAKLGVYIGRRYYGSYAVIPSGSIYLRLVTNFGF